MNLNRFRKFYWIYIGLPLYRWWYRGYFILGVILGWATSSAAQVPQVGDTVVNTQHGIESTYVIQPGDHVIWPDVAHYDRSAWRRPRRLNRGELDLLYRGRLRAEWWHRAPVEMPSMLAEDVAARVTKPGPMEAKSLRAGLRESQSTLTQPTTRRGAETCVSGRFRR